MKSENSTAQIKCTSDSTMHFYQSQSIHITNLEFIGCGGNQVRHVEEFVVEDTKFEGQENSSTALELIETTAQIVNSTFVSNRTGLYKECPILFDQYYDCLNEYFDDFIGGAIGGAIIATNSSVDISRSRFEDNKADRGGAILAEQDSIINMSGNVFISNSASKGGGDISRSRFEDNKADRGGAILAEQDSIINMSGNVFISNSASKGGGALGSSSSTIIIEASEFNDNSARYEGGVLSSRSSTIIIETSEFHDNNATDRGGVLDSDSNTITIADRNFTDNVSLIGAIIYATSRSVIQHIHSLLLINNNIADRYAVIYLSDSEFIGSDSGNVTFSSNL